MRIEIPDQELQGMEVSPERARLSIALGLYQDRDATMGQAARISGLSVTQFMQELGRRRIPMHYDAGAFHEDLKTLEAFSA